MGCKPQFFVEIKNSFIHVSDQIDAEKDAVLEIYRSRALSEYSGICRARELELKQAELENSVPLDVHSASILDDEVRTTVMMRDVPNSYSSSTLVELFDDAGFRGTYDFLYLPVDFRTNMSLGYAFVNFVSSRKAQEFMLFFNGFSTWHFSSPKVCKVFWSDPNQGLEEHVERYRNSPVMHENVPDVFKPRLYENGVRVAFPEPTKRIKLPRVRPAKRRIDAIK
jgi:RNA recognition motif-containing protein